MMSSLVIILTVIILLVVLCLHSTDVFLAVWISVNEPAHTGSLFQTGRAAWWLCKGIVVNSLRAERVSSHSGVICYITGTKSSHSSLTHARRCRGLSESVANTLHCALDTNSYKLLSYKTVCSTRLC